MTSVHLKDVTEYCCIPFHTVHVHSYRYSHGISILLGFGTPLIVPLLCTTDNCKYGTTLCMCAKAFFLLLSRRPCLFLALDDSSTHADPFTYSQKKYCKLVNNAVFICIESLFFVSTTVSCEFHLQHTLWLLRSIYPAGYEYGLSNLGKYWPFRSMGNTMDEYMQGI